MSKKSSKEPGLFCPDTTRKPALIADRRPWLRTNSCSIEQLLVWTYRDQKAENLGAGAHMFAAEQAASGRSVTLQAHSSRMILEHEQLGARVDTSPSLGFDLHEVAELVHAWVRSLTVMEGRLVMECARTGSRPALPTCVRPRIVPAQYGDAGQTRAMANREWHYDKKGRRFPLEWCDVIISNTREQLLRAYERYANWCLSLNMVRDALVLDDRISFELLPVEIDRDIYVEICSHAVDVDRSLSRLFSI